MDAPPRLQRRLAHVLRSVTAAGGETGEASQQQSSSAGDISSVFSSMLGETFDWPARFGSLKAERRPPEPVLRRAWASLGCSLDAELAEIARLQQRAVPVVDYADLRAGRVCVAKLRRRGVVVVRGVVAPATARAWKEGVQRYAAANPSHTGFPADDPQVLELYWSKPQLQARQHPSVVAVLRSLQQLLWTVGGSAEPAEQVAREAIALDASYTYGERLRIRQRGDSSFNLGPHIDGGSIERFEHVHYRRAYDAIWRGEWERYDAWEAYHRARANSNMYPGSAPNGQCTAFRTFQGWLAVSSVGPVPNAGTLRVLPLIQHSTAYLLLRPFLHDVSPNDFCGSIPGMGQDLMRRWHARLYDALVPIPNVEPGDMVLWHPDLVHAVESVNHGREDSSVFYIPGLPGCRRNLEYVRRQRERFEAGRTPPDFPPNDSECGFVGRGGVLDLSELGREMMGFDEASTSTTTGYR